MAAKKITRQQAMNDLKILIESKDRAIRSANEAIATSNKQIDVHTNLIAKTKETLELTKLSQAALQQAMDLYLDHNEKKAADGEES